MTRAGGVGHSSAADPREAGREALVAATGAARAGGGRPRPSLRVGPLRPHRAARRRRRARRPGRASSARRPPARSRAPSASSAAASPPSCPGDGLSFGISHVAWDPADPAAPARTRGGHRPRPRRRGAPALRRCCCSPTRSAGHGREFARGVVRRDERARAARRRVRRPTTTRARATWTFGEGVARPDGVAAVWIDCDRPIGVGSGHGFRPVGCAHVVTKTDGRLVLELDSRPALDDLPRRARRAPAEQRRRCRPHHVPSHPLGAITVSGRHELYPVGPAGEGLQLATGDARGNARGGDGHRRPRARRRRAARRGRTPSSQLVAPARLGARVLRRRPRRAARRLGRRAGRRARSTASGRRARWPASTPTAQFARRIGPGGFHMSSVSVLAI